MVMVILLKFKDKYGNLTLIGHENINLINQVIFENLLLDIEKSFLVYQTRLCII